MTTKDKGDRVPTEGVEVEAIYAGDFTEEGVVSRSIAPRRASRSCTKCVRGHRIPMLVTAVHLPDLIDGVAFSARPSDVGNSYGSRGYQRVKRGDGDGQWLTSP